MAREPLPPAGVGNITPIRRVATPIWEYPPPPLIGADHDPILQIPNSELDRLRHGLSGTELAKLDAARNLLTASPASHTDESLEDSLAIFRAVLGGSTINHLVQAVLDGQIRSRNFFGAMARWITERTAPVGAILRSPEGVATRSLILEQTEPFEWEQHLRGQLSDAATMVLVALEDHLLLWVREHPNASHEERASMALLAPAMLAASEFPHTIQ